MYGQRAGFALIVAILLMSLVVMLLLGLLSQSRIQTLAARIGLQRLEAEQNARLGLMMALGQLQHSAGPDQRVTARAERLGAEVPGERRYWTGVWDTLAAESDPIWLVSGESMDPVDMDPAVELAAVLDWPAAPDRTGQVRVPVIGIEGPGEGLSGRLAWWTVDEGVKASLAKYSPLDDLAGWEVFSPGALESLRSSLAVRHGADVLFPDSGAEAENATGWEQVLEQLRHGLSKEAFALVKPGATEALKAHYHALTWNSFGVLSDCGEGGLKRDLGHPQTSTGGGLAQMDVIRELLARWTHGPDSAQMRGHAEDHPSPGTPGRSTPLLMHEFGLYLGVFRENVGAASRLKLHLTFRAELWNPHAAPLEMTGRGETDLYVRIKNLPPFTASWRTGVGTSGERNGSFSFDVSPLQFEEDAGDASIRDIVTEGIPVDLYDDLASADTLLKPSRFHASMGVTIPDATSGGDDLIALSAGAAEIDIELRTAGGELLQVFENVPFISFSSASVREQELLPVYGSDSPRYADHQAIYHLRLLDEVIQFAPDEPSDMERWFSRHDFRDPRIDFSDTQEGAPSGLVEVDASPGENVALQTNFFMGDPELLSGGNFIRAFDLPLSPVISVGWLQHIHFIGERPFALGNPWGGERNRAFDAFFLSGYPFGAAEDELPEAMEILPNTHLVPLGPAADLKAAALAGNLPEQVLVSGAFNINSTSVDAWRALLASHQLKDWNFRQGYDANPVTRPQVQNGIFRFPQAARLHYKSPFTDYPDYPEVSQAEKALWYKLETGKPDWLKAYDVGMRELRAADVDELARAIVDLQLDRAAPFRSIAEFVNSGLLQDAIDRTSINSVAEGENPDYASQDRTGDDAAVFPRYAPSFLSQADLLSTLAPVLSARSDTFLIRAYGVAFEPLSGQPAAEARCEALVQRFPELVDGADPGAGRRFQILAFRWLNPDPS